MSPRSALGYLFWTRHRRGLTLVGVYWLAAMSFGLAVPARYIQLAEAEARWLPWLAVWVYNLLFLFFIPAMGYLILVFAFGREARLEARDSGFPSRLWSLPLPTPTLTVWPMLWGSATMILGWSTLGGAAGRSCGIDVPLAEPGLALAVFLAWLQAILWTPLPLPWVRVLLMVPAIVVTPIAVLAWKAPAVVLSGVLVFLLLAAYLTAIRGVARARCGDNEPWAWPSRLRRPWTAEGTPRPFASALLAQRWFEWRLRLLAVFPAVVAACVVVWLVFWRLLFSQLPTSDVLDAARVAPPMVAPLLLPELGGFWLTGAVWLVCMPLLASAVGSEMGKLGRSGPRLSSFLATRPISEAMLIRAKLEAAAWSTLAGWGVLAAGFLLWLSLGGQAAEAARQFEAMRQRHVPGLFWGWLIFLASIAVVLTWLQMAQRMWMALTGSRKVMSCAPLSFFAFIGLIIFGDWLTHHPEYWPLPGHLLPWLAGAAVVLKSVAASWSLRALRRRELIPSRILWAALAIWFVLAAGVFAALYALLPPDWFSVHVVILGIVVLLPSTRLALAPLALAWNRHR